MRRLLVLLILASPCLAQVPVVVTGNVTDAGNNPATSGFVQFDIIPKVSSIHYFVTGIGTITQTVSCPISALGQINCNVWGNDVIQPGNTQYRVTIAPGGNITNVVPGECLTGASYSINNPVFCPQVQVNPQQAIVRANPFATNVIPIAANTFTIGSALSPWGNGFFTNLTVTGSFTTPGSLTTTLPLNLLKNGFTHQLTAVTLTAARTWTLQDASDTFVFRNTPDTLTNKTLTSPSISNATLTGNTIAPTIGPAGGQQHIIPAVAPDTFTLLAATQTLTNKTFDISLNTLKTAVNTTGHVPRNNGTQYVDSTLAAADLSNGVTGSGAVVLATSPTITSPTLTTPVINGASTGTGVQGTDTKLLTSGTISGTSSPLCTDANGGATTSSCSIPTGAAKVQALIITSGICTTGGAETKCTSGPYSWPVAFADASYAVTCSAANPTGGGTNPGMYGPYPTTQTASQISVIIQSGSASAAGTVTTATIWCIGVHP